MAVEINKKRVVVIAAFAANTYFSNIIANVESEIATVKMKSLCKNVSIWKKI